MQMSKQGWSLIMVNRAISLVAVLFFCGFISFIAINGTNGIYGKKEVQNISFFHAGVLNFIQIQNF